MSCRLERALRTRRAVAIAIAVIMAIASSSVAIGFLTDDHAFRASLHAGNEHAPAAYDLFRFVPGGAAGNALRVRAGHLPWWSAPDLQIHFIRPLTSLAFAADDRLFGDDPLGYHLVSLAWYLALLIGAALLFRQLLPPAAATLALAVFGLSAAHVDAYAWVSARHVAIAGAFAAAALAARGSRHRWLAPLLFAVGLASSEAALAAAPIWIALELSVAARPWRDRWLACAAPAGLAIAYLIVYAALGGGTRGSGGYHDPLSDPLGFVALAAVRVPLLLGDAALGIPAELAHVIAERWLALLGLVAVGVVALGAWLTARRDAGATAAAGATSEGAAPWATSGSPAAEAALRDTGTRGQIGSPTFSSRPLFSPTTKPTVVAWIVVGGVGGTVLGAAGFPSGRVLLIPDLAFAAVLGVVLWRGLCAAWPGRIVAAVLAIVHLVIAPLGTLRTIRRLEQRARATEAIADQVVRLAPPEGRVFVVAASDPMVFLYPRGILAERAPGAVKCWSVWSTAHASHRITRTGDRTLEIEPIGRTLLDGSFDRLFRAADPPFAVGETFEQCGASITVAAVRDGRPARLEVTLRRSLADPLVALLTWRDHRLERFTPPPPGEMVEIRWSSGPSGAL